jgi:hypothetical protein
MVYSDPALNDIHIEGKAMGWTHWGVRRIKWKTTFSF